MELGVELGAVHVVAATVLGCHHYFFAWYARNVVDGGVAITLQGARLQQIEVSHIGHVYIELKLTLLARKRSAFLVVVGQDDHCHDAVAYGFAVHLHVQLAIGCLQP